MSHSYEIEIKSLLGTAEYADKLKQAITEKGGKLLPERSSSQLNHYFEGGDIQKLAEVLEQYIADDKKEALQKIVTEGKNISLRTREANGEVLIVMKASLSDDSSSNGVSRIEFEHPIALTLDELDALVLGAGFTYQAKWSRAREEYELGNTHICLDKNAGYGYLAEFERVIDDASVVEDVKQELLDLMAEFGVSELPQDRLERMFAYYNNNWQDYYGTDKVFVIE